MTGSPPNEIVVGYMEEVRTYLPTLVDGLARLSPEAPPDPALVEELHRLVHTIGGASHMVGILGLSRIAGQMETALAEVDAGTLPLTPELIAAMGDTVERFRNYCAGLMGGGLSPRAMLERTIRDFRRARSLPEAEDEAVLAPLLDGIPEYEAGAGLDPEADAEPEPPEEPPPPRVRSTPAPPPPPSEMPELPPEVIEGFFEEAREHLDELDGALNRLEGQIARLAPITRDQRETVRQIRRSIHTLKGSAAVIGLSPIAAWGHAVEDFLDWLYEGASEIGPEIVGLLQDSADLMARLVAHPAEAMNERAESIRVQYERFMGASAPSAPAGQSTGKARGEVAVEAPATAILRRPEGEAEDSSEDGSPAGRPGRRQTLRVGTDRIDAMVNLAGELMIATGAFEGQMKGLESAFQELDLARNRLREIARQMETGFEVKALGRLRRGKDAEGFQDFDALELDRYSELNLIIRTLTETAIDVGAIQSRLGHLHGEFDTHLGRQQVVLREIQDQMMQVRMLPMSTLGNRLRRTVREVAKRLDKRVRLVMEGEGIELDRLVWDRITDPLMHLLRNAVDHGIERPEARKAAGKAPAALVKLSARREGNRVVIQIADDGAGLDYRAIRRKAIQGGFIQENDEPGEEALAGLIFRAGFSTRDTISEVSGRGVGMDVVRENIQELKGSIRVASWPGRGTRFTIRIPLTLAAVRALLFSLGERTYAIPLNEVREILRADPEQIIEAPRRSIRVGERLLPLHSLRELLPATPRPPAGVEAPPLVLLVSPGDRLRGVEIDGLLGQREIVIKGLGSHLRHVRGISGVTIVGDGSVVPILNLPELLGETGVAGLPRVDAAAAPQPAQERPLSILVVDDSVSIRQVVSRLMENQGWRVRTARDGLDALEQVRAERPDLIVLDIEMPRMNGYEFLSALGGEPAVRDVPVVMLTSRATAKHQDRAVSLGASGFVIKPYNDNEFVDLVLNLAG
jgi:chemosensory pili system protein ChpA (sensor histidine kinase/response regulator)